MTSIPEEVLGNHTAALGKTGSGKSSTSRLIVEQVVAAGFRVCVLDAIKSDWWGITSSANGKKPGLPFRILGGPRGHVPLHASAGAALGRLVGEGKLPLSIVDMADFGPGDHQRFFVDFSEALWKSVRGVLYLVIEEAHEFAPKERAGLGAESMAIHWAKKLATGGRSKGIRLLVATQRVQSLHNAVLGSCETLIAHRLTMPADQKPVLDWLKANVDKGTVDQVAGSLSSLPTGTAWLCSGEARIFQKTAFPKFSTFDNTATPTGDGEAAAVTTAPVDAAELRAILGDAVKEADANDPKALKAEIARLRAAGGGASASAIAEAEERAYQRGLSDGERREWRRAMEAAHARHEVAIAELRHHLNRDLADFREGEAPAPPQADRPIRQPSREKSTSAPPVNRPTPTGADAALSGPQRQLLSALAWWKRMGHDTPSRPQIAGIAGWKITSGHLKNVIGSLKTRGLVEYPQPSTVRLTASGVAAAPEPDMGATLHDGLRGILTGPQRSIFDALVESGDAMTREALAARCGWEPTSGHLKNVIGSMKTLEIVEYPAPSVVALQPWVIQ